MRPRCCVIAPGSWTCTSAELPFHGGLVCCRGSLVRCFEVVPHKSIGATPRNLGTMSAIKARAGLELDFDAEVARFLKSLADIEALHGAMKAEDAKALVRHHTTHHFHQFQLV